MKMPILISNWEEERKEGFLKFFCKKSLTLLLIFVTAEFVGIILQRKQLDLSRFIIIIIVVLVVVIIAWFGREIWYKKYLNSNK